MDGVTILNTYTTYSFLWAFMLSMGVIFGCFLIVASFHFLDENVIISGVCFGLVIVIILGCIAIPRTETIHEVVITDGVSWVELNERYEVRQVRGRILKVRERESKKEGADDA